MGFGSFKVFGVVYVIVKVVDVKVWVGEVSDYVMVLIGIVFICVSVGNYGLLFVVGVFFFGVKVVVVIVEMVFEVFVDRLCVKGVDVVWVGQIYEEGMVEVQCFVVVNGWYLLFDSIWDGMIVFGYDVMEGYLVMGDEVVGQIFELLIYVFL